MNTLVNVARYQMVDRLQYLALPWAVLAFSFGVNIVIFALTPPSPHNAHYSGGVAAFYGFLFAAGVMSMTRSLPFGLALGISRRVYYLGTALLVGALGVADGLVLTVLQAVERATGGWGMTVHFFRIPWILNGPWYLTWLTWFVLLALAFLYGMWYGLVFRRWNVPGLLAFLAAQVLVALAIVSAVTLAHDWPAVGRVFTTLTAPGLTGLLAGLAVLLGAGGFTTLRRVTV